MEENLVTIIVPIYNAEEYLSKCLDSLVNQTYKNLEILLINDGSIDNSEKICNEYKNKDARIRYYEKTNSGVSDTRNYGLERATGDYIAFLDSDDWFDIYTLENCMKIINECNIDILRFSYLKELGNCTFKYKYTIHTDMKIEKKQYDEMIYKYIFNTFDLSNVCGAIFDRKLLKDIYFDSHISNGEDFKFMIEALLKSESIYFIDNPYYHYNYNMSSLTNNLDTDKMKKRITDNVQIYRNILDRLQKSEIYQNQMEKRVIDTMLSIQYQASNLSYKEYADFLQYVQGYLNKNGIEYAINQSYICYIYTRFKFFVKNTIKKIIIAFK